MNPFASGRRIWAIMIKELVQMRRDRLTFAMLFGIPVLQLLLFGYAINTDPKALPTAVRVADSSPFSRALLTGLENSSYFRITRRAESEAEVNELLARGDVQFAVTVPADFSRKLQRGERPVLLVEADATDPAATGPALTAVTQLSRTALGRELSGPLAHLNATEPGFDLRVHRRYNPENVTQYNVVPGLVGTILTMTMVIMTSLGMTRERERGTMESLLATPARPAEVMLGKIVPYILVGYVQVIVILLAAAFLFAVPFVGSLLLLSVLLVLFIAANLAVGFTFSTLAKNQLQAMQMAFFFFLPSILLSGFMFPFRGMPDWAQTIGEVLPLTHFLRIVRGILLKGNGGPEVWPDAWPLLVFTAAAMALALLRYRRTLD